MSLSNFFICKDLTTMWIIYFRNNISSLKQSFLYIHSAINTNFIAIKMDEKNIVSGLKMVCVHVKRARNIINFKYWQIRVFQRRNAIYFINKCTVNIVSKIWAKMNSYWAEVNELTSKTLICIKDSNTNWVLYQRQQY